MSWTQVLLLGVPAAAAVGFVFALLVRRLMVRELRKGLEPLLEDLRSARQELDQLAVQVAMTRRRMDRALGRVHTEPEDGERS